RREPGAAGGADAPGVAVPGTAPEDAAGRRSALSARIRPVLVRTPLPHVPQHVVQTPTVRPLLPHRVRLGIAIPLVPGDLRQVLAIPRHPRPGPAGILPLRLRWQ